MVLLFSGITQAQENAFDQVLKQGTLLYNMGLYKQGIKMLDQERVSILADSGKQNRQYGLILFWLAHLYNRDYQFEKADTHVREAIQIGGNLIGKNHPKMAKALTLLAGICITRGQYEEAEIHLKKAKEIKRREKGIRHYEYATILGEQANLEASLGQYSQAEQHFKEALIIGDSVLKGRDHLMYAIGLNNLAILYRHIKAYDTAIVYLHQAVQMAERLVGKKHSVYLNFSSNLVNLYIMSGQYSKAEALCKTVLIAKEQASGKISVPYFISLSNLVLLSSKRGNNEEVKKRGEEFLRNSAQLKVETHPEYPNIILDIGKAYWESGNIIKAAFLIDSAATLTQSYLLKNATFLPENQKSSNILSKIYLRDAQFSFSLATQGKDSRIKAYNLCLLWKSFLLKSENELRNRVIKEGDQALLTTYLNWIGFKRSIDSHYLYPQNKKLNIQKLENQADSLEKILLSEIKGFVDYQKPLKVTWKDVQSRVTDTSAVIEFIKFNSTNRQNNKNSTIYAALLLRKDADAPQFIPLFKASKLDQILRHHKTVTTNELYRGGGMVGSPRTITPNGRLYNLIWKPLEPYLEEITEVYFSPDGKLHNIAFGALQSTNGIPLSDIFKLHQLSTTSYLALDKKPLTAQDIHSAVLIGNPQCNLGYEQSKNPEIPTFQSDLFPSLPGAAFEVDEIAQMHAELGIEHWVYKGRNAQEQRICRHQGSEAPTVLHFAMHSYTRPDSRISQVTQKPMAHYGLALAGAHNSLSQDSLFSGSEDGILYASEISSMNLHNTRLVVLSGCNTGLGVIQDSEGVFGLQRAFKLAGADYILMSLWAVEDLSTKEFMVEFYKQLFTGNNIREAFSQAQKYMKEAYPNDPETWAGFVLVE